VRPVPLEEVFVNHLNWNLPREVRGYWPRVAARALAEGLGPILLFAPRRQATESIAAELARQLPNQHPLELTEEQRHLVGDHLAKMLKSRIAYHHSGMSYAVRAGVVEPLAKAGQLRVVVATMGLAAGINFSLRSVALAGESYRRDRVEVAIRPDEILQMAGRAGRRGIDETGYFLVSANGIRLAEGYPAHLSRSGMVDWGTLLGIMEGAAAQGDDPFQAAVKIQERLFTTKPIHLGVECSLKHPDAPCGLTTDAERARHVRRQVRQMINSRGEWEVFPKSSEVRISEIVVGPPLSDSEARTATGRDLPPLLSDPDALGKIGPGTLVKLNNATGAAATYGRSVTVAEVLEDGRIMIAKPTRRQTSWKGRHATRERWQQKIVPLIEAQYRKQNLPVIQFRDQPPRIVAILSLAEQSLHVPVDSHGVALWKPAERHVGQPDCERCPLTELCRELPTATGTALLWKRMDLVDPAGRPTRRGRIVSFFSAGAGLAIAAALEDETYSMDELIYDLANLDAGFRFCQEENRFAGRLAVACREVYGTRSVAG
ncbi:MAG TPA: helicase-related protein, partial [Verrucomicrobiae bacterium]|nr:helicase-related protein [Verrucomicrobiae bacterium]